MICECCAEVPILMAMAFPRTYSREPSALDARLVCERGVHQIPWERSCVAFTNASIAGDRADTVGHLGAAAFVCVCVPGRVVCLWSLCGVSLSRTRTRARTPARGLCAACCPCLRQRVVPVCLLCWLAMRGGKTVHGVIPRSGAGGA